MRNIKASGRDFDFGVLKYLMYKKIKNSFSCYLCEHEIAAESRSRARAGFIRIISWEWLHP